MATVSERGQITIPKSLRESMGIRPGQTLAVREVRGQLVLTKETTGDKWDSVIGILDSGQTTDEIMEELRGPVDTCD
ncbi:MAG TPA: AbrB/MazE/SpoVT family DNA-binding domain-containing protein [Longimicrobiaceae bacterium]|nr:AbrB/MazE/SpoVT family DNA-binding domain-containing protein [Longimicrobiaceae bacterium]